jgi:hypothetical protein
MINKCRAFADEKKRYEVIGSHYYLLIDHYFRTIYFEIVYGSNTRQSYIIKLFQIFNFFSVFFFFRFFPSIFFSVNFFFRQFFFLSVGWVRRQLRSYEKKVTNHRNGSDYS